MYVSRRHELPAAVYSLVEQIPGTVLLEGSGWRQSTNEEPWTTLFTAPLRVAVAHNAEQVAELFAEIGQAVHAGLSAAGFFSYECGGAFEPRAGMRPPRAGQPLAWFGIYERGYLFDHQQGEFVGGEPPELDRFEKASDFAQDSDDLNARLALSEADYARRIAEIHELIRAGDVYQLNFTVPLRVQAPGSSAALHARLRARQPAAYGAFLHGQSGRHILSFSPELFFRLDEADRVDEPDAARRITTQPMKGTAPRGRTLREDREIAAWLQNDAKNRSENLMIVDLLRNDLGRVARFGSVRAEKLFEVQRLPTLWQMTSTITAELRQDIGYEAIFRALFPCGSITGAPKVRAMQLIGQLEGQPRDVYTGAIGFFSPRQTVFNVAIRTLEFQAGKGKMGVGSGVVIDSDAEAEYRECLLKAEFLTRSTGQRPQELALIETLLWENDYPLLSLHLDRLSESAEYFGFRCDRASIAAALEQHAAGFAAGQAHRVRLLLNFDGEVQITDEVMPQGLREALLAGRPANREVGRVRIAAERTDASDSMLFHKTTQRPLYARAYQEAQREGLYDLLFLNQRGQVTEGAISSVLIETGGRWLTPPVECGLLPGVYRRYLLEKRPEIQEQVLSLDDLRQAESIYLANSVRGLRRVVLEP